MRRRPKIAVHLSRAAVVGQSFEGELSLACPRPLTIDRLALELTGSVWRAAGSGNQQRTQREECLRMGIVLVEQRRELPEGVSRFRFRCQLPEGLPPSYYGHSLDIRYTLRVHASIPWWVDARVAFQIQVGLPPSSPRTEPRLFATSSDGPRGTDPYIEVSLERDAFAPKDILSGVASLGNTAHNRYRELVFSLLGYEQIELGASKDQALALQHRFTLPVPAQEEGAEVPFQLSLPGELPPTFSRPGFGLLWYFQAQAVVSWTTDAKVAHPISILPAGSQTTTAPRPALSVGARRMAQLWSLAAAPLGLDAQTNQLHGERFGASLLLRRELREGEGFVLAGSLRYPSLQLGLRVEPRSALRQLLGRDPTGVAAWDKRHQTYARELAQVQPVAEHLYPHLHELTLQRMTDEELHLQFPSNGGRVEQLRAAGQLLLDLARGLQEGRRHIPPPRSLTAGLASWQELAHALRAPLETARMAIAGHLEGLPAEVVTTWSPHGEARSTQLQLHLPVPLDSRYTLRWESPQPLPSGLPPEAQELLARLTTSALALSLEGSTLRADLPAPLLDANLARETLLRIARLSTLLRGNTGPYR